jgi:hypothetical protein
LKLLRESEMVQAVIIQIDEAVDASGFQNTRYIFHDIKAVWSIILKDKSDPDKIEHPPNHPKVHEYPSEYILYLFYNKYVF